MKIEIERKFLLRDNSWKQHAIGVTYRQGYLNENGLNTVRVRIAGDRGYLAIKSKNKGISRQEFEYEIPQTDASELLKLAGDSVVEKIRYTITYGGNQWEVDEFLGKNSGLLVAEIELSSEDQPFDRPLWLGKEVSDDIRYYNANLAKHPFSEW